MRRLPDVSLYASISSTPTLCYQRTKYQAVSIPLNPKIASEASKTQSCRLPVCSRAKRLIYKQQFRLSGVSSNFYSLGPQLLQSIHTMCIFIAEVRTHFL